MNRDPIAAPALGLSSRWLNPVAFVLLGHAVLAVLIFWVDLQWLRVGLATVLTLFGSGYSLVTALFPRSLHLDALQRVALAGGLSLAVGGILGVALARSVWGLQPIPLLVATALFNLVCYGVIVYRRGRRADAQDGEGFAEHTSFAEDLRGRVVEQSWGSVALTVVLIAVLVVGVRAFGRTAAAAGGDPPMTEFFLLDEDGLTEAYPVTVRPDQTLAINYGIVNREGETAVYRVEASVEGETIGKSEPLTLSPGKTLQAEVVLEWPEEGAAARPGPQKVEFTLYWEEQRHRSLHLWLDVEPAETSAGADAAPGSGL